MPETTYSKENRLLAFMRKNRVDSVSPEIRETVLSGYRESIIEAAAIPEDWFIFDISQTELA